MSIIFYIAVVDWVQELRMVYNQKKHWISSVLFAPAGIELLNLWNDFRKVVQFIDDNQTWLHPLMDRVAANKKAEEK